jgi:hypothetical protein
MTKKKKADTPERQSLGEENYPLDRGHLPRP